MLGEGGLDGGAEVRPEGVHRNLPNQDLCGGGGGADGGPATRRDEVAEDHSPALAEDVEGAADQTAGEETADGLDHLVGGHLGGGPVEVLAREDVERLLHTLVRALLHRGHQRQPPRRPCNQPARNCQLVQSSGGGHGGEAASAPLETWL